MRNSDTSPSRSLLKHLHERAVQKIREFVTQEFSCDWRGVIPSPITGMDGNQEFLAWITIPQAGIRVEAC